jgi:CRISPR system Cascade subunit CasA
VTRLALVQANNATLFDHRAEHEAAHLSPPEAARLLIAYQAFAIGGGVSKPFNFTHGPLAREKGILALLMGDNLFETLWLNCLEYTKHTPVPGTSEDRPVWEATAPRTPRKSGTALLGYLDYLTFPSRRIRLIPDEGDELAFSSMVFLQGLSLADTSLREPMTLYREQKDGSWRTVQLEAGRACWRDIHALLAQSGQTIRPQALVRLGDLKEDGYLDENREFTLSIIGLCTDRAKISLWRHETLPLPVKYLGNKELMDRLADALHAADIGGSALYSSCRSLASIACQVQDGSADRDRVVAMVENLAPDTRYWPQLEHPFRQLIVELPNADKPGRRELIDQWRERVRQTASDTFEQIVDGIDSSPKMLRAVYHDSGKHWSAQHTLNHHLAKLKPNPTETEEVDHEPATSN